jgi:integrase/recombinase XerD
VERRLVALRGFLRYASSQGWLGDDLSGAVRLDGVPERTPRTLQGDDRDAVINALHDASLKDKRDRALILLLLSSGARLSEVLRLNRRDWKHNRLILRGRGGRQRPALITSRTRRAVDEYLEARRDSSAALFVSLQPMSRHRRNNRLTAAGARHVCRTVATSAGIPPFGPREIRDTVGRLVQQECRNPRLTAATLGLDGLRAVASYVDPSAADPRSARGALERLGL